MTTTMASKTPDLNLHGLAPFVFPGAKQPAGVSAGNDPASSVELLTVDGAINYLGVSEPTIFARIREGKLHAFKFKGRTYLHPHELETERQRMLEKRGRGRVVGSTATQPAAAQLVEAPKPPKPAPSKPEPVHQSIANYKGETAAAAYRLFGANKGIRDVVMDLEISVELAEHLYTHWRKSGPELHITPKALARIRNRFQWFGEATEEGFMGALDAFIDREITRLAHEKNLLPKEGDTIPDHEREMLEAAEKEEAEDQ